MKQANHFNNYGFVLPRITSWVFRSAAAGGNVDMGLYWEPMGSMVLEYGFCKSTTNIMPGMESRYWYQTGNIAYSQTSSPVNLCSGFVSDVFYVRAYIRNVAGIVWSDVVVVNTRDLIKYPPSITTSAIAYKLITIADGGGVVTNDGGDPVTSRGVCWNTNVAVPPTIANNRTQDGTGTGTFTSRLSGLTPNTTYYVRAYATNSLGTNYGTTVSLTTDAAGAPTTETYNLQKTATYSSVNVFGRIVDDGGAAITQRGFCWNTAGNPTMNDHVVYASGSGSGDFSAMITGLPGSTDVHVKTFAINSYGVGIGGQWTFPTDAAPAGVVVFTLSTNSVNSEWSASYINSNTILHWEVTGAVTASADGYTPSFDLSTPGTKNIVVTSLGGPSSVSTVSFGQCGLTNFNASGSPYIVQINLGENALTSIDISNNRDMFRLDIGKNNITSIDTSNNPLLRILSIHDNPMSSINLGMSPSLEDVHLDRNMLTSVSMNENQKIKILALTGNRLSKAAADSILDTLIGYNNTAGSNLIMDLQIPQIYPDPAKVAALDAIWQYVLV